MRKKKCEIQEKRGDGILKTLVFVFFFFLAAVKKEEKERSKATKPTKIDKQGLNRNVFMLVEKVQN